jgi:hypothetical protein
MVHCGEDDRTCVGEVGGVINAGDDTDSSGTADDDVEGDAASEADEGEDGDVVDVRAVGLPVPEICW